MRGSNSEVGEVVQLRAELEELRQQMEAREGSARRWKKCALRVLLFGNVAALLSVPVVLFASDLQTADIDAANIVAGEKVEASKVRALFDNIQAAINDNADRISALEARPAELYAVARWDGDGGACDFRTSGGVFPNTLLIGLAGCSADVEFEGPATVSDSDGGGDTWGLKLPNAPPGKYFVVAQALISHANANGDCLYSFSVDGGLTFGSVDGATVDSSFGVAYGISQKTTFTLASAQDVNIDTYHRRTYNSGSAHICILDPAPTNVVTIAVFRYPL